MQILLFSQQAAKFIQFTFLIFKQVDEIEIQVSALNDSEDWMLSKVNVVSAQIWTDLLASPPSPYQQKLHPYLDLYWINGTESLQT